MNMNDEQDMEENQEGELVKQDEKMEIEEVHKTEIQMEQQTLEEGGCEM